MKLFKSLKDKAQAYLDQYKQNDPATYAAAQQAIGGVLILDGLVGIDNPFDKNKRPGIVGSLAGVFVGVIFMCLPLVTNAFTGFDKMTATTNATIVAIGAPVSHESSSSSNSDTQSTPTCSITAKYTVNGVEYKSTSAVSSSGNCSLTPGTTVVVNYNPDQPNKWANDIGSLSLVFTIFFWAGVVVVITSMFTFVLRLLSIIFGWRLLKSGRALAATLPQGTNLGTVVKEIEQHFKGSVFGATVPMPYNQSPVQPQSPIQPVVAPPVVATPPVEPTVVSPTTIVNQPTPSTNPQPPVNPPNPPTPPTPPIPPAQTL